MTGGPVWHGRAAWRASRAWREFRTQIDHWLTSWPPRKPDLILVGPSGGWCLPNGFLRRFERIVAIDPDPLARVVFHLRHGRELNARGVEVIWRRADFFENMDAWLSDYPDAAILFCNVLGQLRYVCQDQDDLETQLSQLSRRLEGRAWASFHDLLSGRGTPARILRKTPGYLPCETVLRLFGLDGVWLDHLTSGVFPSSAPRRLIAWTFDRRRVHLVEAGFVTPKPTSPPS